MLSAAHMKRRPGEQPRARLHLRADRLGLNDEDREALRLEYARR